VAFSALDPYLYPPLMGSSSPFRAVASQPAAHRAFAQPVLAGGALGAVFGILYPAAHVAIEPAQVLAGLVSYPSDNVFWLYQTRVWTVLHQIFALLLVAGVDERTLTQLASAGVGALNFAALTAFARALGAPRAYSIVAPFLLWALNPLGWGFGYPILMIGHPHTYGTVGLAWVVLACSAIGAGRWTLGAALLGFAPALHPAVGATMAALTGICVLYDWRSLRPHLPALLRGGAIGAGLAALSLAVHVFMLPVAPSGDAAEIARLYPVFIEQWDAHRQPVDLVAWNGWLLALGVAIAATWLPRARGEVARALLLRILLASALFGAVFASVRQVAPADAIPSVVLSAMPARILNFPILTFVPLLVAALARDDASLVARITLIVFTAGALVWSYAPDLETWGLPVVGFAALGELLRRSATPRRLPRVFDLALATAVVIEIGYVLVLGARLHPRRMDTQLRDRTTDVALAAASRGSGLLAVAPGVERAQLATRRPIVIDPQAIDMVTYVPAGLPGLARAIEGLYGIDFAAPLERDRNKAAIPIATVRTIWERRSLDDWNRVARDFDVQEILVPARWKLQLSEIARSPAFRLYHVGAGAVSPKPSE
jgi:hypothetical protein